MQNLSTFVESLQWNVPCYRCLLGRTGADGPSYAESVKMYQTVYLPRLCIKRSEKRRSEFDLILSLINNFDGSWCTLYTQPLLPLQTLEVEEVIFDKTLELDLTLSRITESKVSADQYLPSLELKLTQQSMIVVPLVHPSNSLILIYQYYRPIHFQVGFIHWSSMFISTITVVKSVLQPVLPMINVVKFLSLIFSDSTGKIYAGRYLGGTLIFQTWEQRWQQLAGDRAT